MLICGKEWDIKGRTVSEILEITGFSGSRCAVEADGAIVKREEFDTFAPHEDSVLEIVRFVGGG